MTTLPPEGSPNSYTAPPWSSTSLQSAALVDGSAESGVQRRRHRRQSKRLPREGRRQWHRVLSRRWFVKRGDLYIQTKFSPYKPGRDPAIYPYDTTKPREDQVRESAASSLRNLKTTYIDCLVLHSLYQDVADTLRAWAAMEALVPATARSLGVSNADLATLRLLCARARIRPVVVQNRFTQDDAAAPDRPGMPPGLPYPLVPYDRDVRAFCRQEGIAYGPWGVLWGNPKLVEEMGGVFEEMGALAGVTKEVAFYSYLVRCGGCDVSILCGTKREERMVETVEGMARMEEFLAVGADDGGEKRERQRRWRELEGVVKRVVDGE